jgi:hypothetical protein
VCASWTRTAPEFSRVKVAFGPGAIARLTRKGSLNVARVSLESGPASVWLGHALTAEGFPIFGLDAHHTSWLAIRTLLPLSLLASIRRG